MKQRRPIVKEKLCNYGKITYRLPYPSEVFSLLSQMQLQKETLEKQQLSSDDINSSFEMVGRIIDCLDEFIINVELIIDDEAITEKEIALSHPRLIRPLTEIATEFLSLLGDNDTKKNGVVIS